MNGGDDVLAYVGGHVQFQAGQGSFHSVCKAATVDQGLQARLGFNHVSKGNFMCRQARIEALGNDSTQPSLRICGSSHEEQLVFVVEGHQGGSRPPCLTQFTPALMEVDARKEVFGLFCIVETAFFDHWQLRMQRFRDHRKNTDAVTGRAAFLTAVDLHTLDAARR